MNGGETAVSDLNLLWWKRPFANKSGRDWQAGCGSVQKPATAASRALIKGETMSSCKKGFLALVGITAFLSVAIFSNFQSGEGQVSILWGLLIGVILGVFMCLYLSTSYNTKTWEPKNPNAKFNNINGLWGPAIGVLIAGIMSRYFEPLVGGFIFGCIVTWLLITVGYIVFHSCKNAR